MNNKHDIQNRADITLLVHSFYGSVRENELLGPIFQEKIKDDWEPHLEKMVGFWQTILLHEPTYNGSPFPLHMQLPISAIHFDTWLQLWHATINNHFEGEKATEAKWRGDKMAALFVSKIEYYKENQQAKPLI